MIASSIWNAKQFSKIQSDQNGQKDNSYAKISHFYHQKMSCGVYFSFLLLNSLSFLQQQVEFQLSNSRMLTSQAYSIRGTNLAKIKPRCKRKNKTSSTNRQLPTDIYQRFLNNICKRRLKFLKQKMNEYYGKNFPVNYKKNYEFQEEWQKRTYLEEKTNEKFINEESMVDIVLSFLTIIVYTSTVWLSNIDYFVIDDEVMPFYHQMYAFALIVLLFNVSFKVLNDNTKNMSLSWLKSFAKSQIKSILLFTYLITKLSGVNDIRNVFWFLLQSSMLLILYQKASKRYNGVRIMNFSLQYEYQTKVLDMIITIFIIAHIIALILYSSIKLSPDNNWATNLQIDHSDEFVVYLYSLYFCTTTIMTIGYGDIVPKNPSEVAIVIFVQIFGVVMLAYIINQIGYCISSLRKDQQIIQKDLSILQKLKRHYKMNFSQINKVRSHILNNKPRTSQLSPDEEKGILMKLNEEIRAQITKQNLVSVVKSSIFFLCRWTYHFQNSISSKLIHVMFSPNDILPQPEGKERIYIIKSGKIQIFVSRTYGKKGTNNVLKTITNTIDSEVTDNCYGYSSVVSMRPVKLFAVSKDFTSCYYLDKEKFLQSTMERINDTQYYHELKNQIDHAITSESIEVPSLHNSKHHYNPAKSVVIRKYCKFSSENQDRKYIHRRNRLTFRSAKPIFDQQIKRRIKQTFIGSVASFDTICFGQISDDLKASKTQTVRAKSSSDQMSQILIQGNTRNFLDHFFQSSKDYINYFCKSNRQQVLKRYEMNTFNSLNPISMKKSKRLNFSQAGNLQFERYLST